MSPLTPEDQRISSNFQPCACQPSNPELSSLTSQLSGCAGHIPASIHPDWIARVSKNSQHFPTSLSKAFRLHVHHDGGVLQAELAVEDAEGFLQRLDFLGQPEFVDVHDDIAGGLRLARLRDG